MAKKLFKFVCVSALPADEGSVGVKYLVSDNGHFVGVSPRKDQPERIMLKHWREDQAPTCSLVERYQPRQQVRRMTHTIFKAMKRGMLKVHLPNGAKDENANPWVTATDIVTAMKAFGVATEAPKPSKPKSKKTTKKEDS